MKFTSKVVVTLELDEHELETVMGSVIVVANSKPEREGNLKEHAKIFLKDYEKASGDFWTEVK